MGKRPSCRSCLHCTPPTAAAMGWCKLRRLAIHPELSGEFWCHHWTPLPPRLPHTGQEGLGTSLPGADATPPGASQQLALTPLLVEG